ncbi:MAG: NADH-quinone oxidoreductase subunit NuoN [Alphaproteobacteria bacterium]|nr:NADH-quinone oxidoreductase subunit NuoN [Alphaproteobacteria bacterium]
MQTLLFGDIATLASEMVIALAAMALLMIGVFRGDRSTRLVAWLSVLTLAAALALLLDGGDSTTIALRGMFVADPFALFAKVVVLLGSAFAIVLSMAYIEREGMARFEYPVLILFATLGMMMMVSANNLMALYLGVELQSLALYVVAALRRDSLRSTEAGLKYFVLGALSSGMLLYGCSLIYGFTGTTSFESLSALFLDRGAQPSLGLLIGLVFLISGLAFKVSAVPFHMWAPDVYEGAPTPVTAFFAVAPKVAAMALFLRAVIAPFIELVGQWQQIIVFIAIASMLLGAFAAIHQTNIKRLMAYSSIGHMGYALVGLAAGTPEGVRGVLVYLAIYAAMNVGAFALILTMRQKGGMVEGISDLAGLSRTHPFRAGFFAIFMFSLAGIPPLAGFFAKFYVFIAAVNAGLYALAVIGVLASVVGAYYYLRIVKIMYFDAPTEPFVRPIGGEMTVIVGLTGAFTLLYVFYPAPLIAAAQTAAQALFR